MRFIETEDVRVTYFEPTGDYLVPYATQSFVNALLAQKADSATYPTEGYGAAAGLFGFRQRDDAQHAAKPDLLRHRADWTDVRDVQSRRTTVYVRQS